MVQVDRKPMRPKRHSVANLYGSTDSSHVRDNYQPSPQERKPQKTLQFDTDSTDMIKLPQIDSTKLPLIKQNLARVTASRRRKPDPDNNITNNNANKTPDETQTNQQRRRKQTDVSADDIRRLVLRLHRKNTSITDPDMMTEVEKRIYLFLKKSMPSVDEEMTTTIDVDEVEDAVHAWRRRRDRLQSRVWADDALTQLNITLGDGFHSLLHGGRNSVTTYDDDRERLFFEMQVKPRQLPPIHSITDKHLVSRYHAASFVTQPAPALTAALMKELSYCRYLRKPPLRYQYQTCYRRLSHSP